MRRRGASGLLSEELLRAGLEQRELRRRLEEEKPLLDVTLRKFGRPCRPTGSFAVPPRRGQDCGGRLFDLRMILLPPQAQRKRKVTGPDEQHVDPRRGGNFVDVRKRGQLLEDHRDDHVAVG